MNYLVRDRDVIFNLAGQVSHIDSMRDPYTDLEINCRSQLTVLEACRNHNPRVKVVFAGTRQVYGTTEIAAGRRNASGASRPTSTASTKRRASTYHLVYNNVFGVRACSLATDQRLRSAPADQTQPPGLHRLVHPPRGREPDDSDLRRRFTAPRFRLRRRCGRRLPARRRQRRVQRRSVQRRRRSADQSPRTDDAARSTAPVRARCATSSGRPNRKRSTSAASTPTRASSRASPAGRRRWRSATAWRGRSRSTASICNHYVEPAEGAASA